MIYKLMEIATLYGEYVKQLKYNKDDISYHELHRKVLDDCFSESDFIHKYFQNDLHLETMHIYYNFTELQNKWDENENKDPFSILLRQISFFKPDVILIMNIWLFPKEKLYQIKQVLHNKVRFVCYHFSWVNDLTKELLPLYDLVLTGSNYMGEKMKSYSSNVRVVRHAFEPEILEKIDSGGNNPKVGFVGSIMIGTSGHTNRIDMFSALIKNNIEFDYYGRVYGSFFNPRSLYDHIVHEPYKLLERQKTVKYLNGICQPSQFGLAYYNCLARYGININAHAEIAATGAGNQRMFEVTGVGSCLVTDYREENKLLFEEDKEIIVYRNNNELVEKLKYLLSHPEVAKNIADNGQKRTLKDHTYRNKAKQINDYIQELFR